MTSHLWAARVRDASFWMLCATIAYAPLVYGGLTPAAILTINWMLGAAVGLWTIGTNAAQSRNSKVEGRKRRGGGEGSETPDNGEPPTNNQSAIRPSQAAVSRSLIVICVCVLVFGWWMVFNAKGIYDSNHYIFAAIASWLPSLPGSVDQGLSSASMVRVTLLLGTILLVADLVRDQRWLLRVGWTVGVTGGLIAFLGLVQKASGAPMIFWRDVEQPSKTFFGTFFYHGNAGAYINLALPITIGLALRTFTRPTQPLVRALWLTLAVSSVVAVFANTSRMSQALGGGVLVVLAVGLLPKALVAARSRMEWGTAVAGALAVLFALFAVVQASRLDRAFQRWEQASETVPRDARWNAAKAAWGAVPEAGWNGFGPGTFGVVFPFYTAGWGEGLRGWWVFLHQDYLQTLLEWGLLGSGLFGCLFFGGMAVGVRNLWHAGAIRRTTAFRLAERQRRQAESTGSSELEKFEWSPRQRLLLPLVLLGLASVALHALVDFPLQIPSIQLYVAVYLGVCWGSSTWGGGRIIGS